MKYTIFFFLIFFQKYIYSLIINKSKNTLMEISKIETGDLIFVGIPEQKGESLGNAVASSTGVGTNKIIHVGILEVNINYNKFKEIYVIEASNLKGVIRDTLKNFLHNNLIPQFSSKIFIKRVKDATEKEKNQWIIEAKKHIGKKYNFKYIPSEDSLYCSELVYISYLKENKEHIFKEEEMQFKDKDGNIPLYWIKNFEKLNMEIPIGKLGTNPQKMFLDENLEFVCEIKDKI